MPEKNIQTTTEIPKHTEEGRKRDGRQKTDGKKDRRTERKTNGHPDRQKDTRTHVTLV